MFDPLFEDELQKLISSAQLPPPEKPAAEIEASTSAAENRIINRSAFQPFVGGSGRFQQRSSTSSMNKRLIEFQRKNWSRKMEMIEPEKQRCLKHTMNERMRRERERQSFLELHSILPPGIRNEKISIIQSAVTEIRKLEQLKAELQRKNSTMVESVAREGRVEEGGGEKRTTKITVRVENPTSGIDSVQEVLKCLKHMGLSAKSIGLELSKQELAAVVEIDNEIEAAQVEAVIRTTLAEVDMWLADDHNFYCT